MRSSKQASVQPSWLVVLLVLWSFQAPQGACSHPHPTPASSAKAAQQPSTAATWSSSGCQPRARRFLHPPLVYNARALKANSSQPIDPELAAQWQVLLTFRKANQDCGMWVDDWPTTIPTTTSDWAPVTVKNNRIVEVDFMGLCSSDALSIWSKFPDLVKLDVSFSDNKTRALPASWSVLTGLTDLSVRPYCSNWPDDCTFPSSVPSEWSSLTRLTRLVLYGWTAQGKLPSSWSALKQMKSLTLPPKGLNGPDLPSSWSQLTSLTQLVLPGDIAWPSGSANTPGQTLFPKSWSNMKNLRDLDTSCVNLVSKPAQNGIPVAPYLTSLTTQCGGDDGCGAAVQVTQLSTLSQMTNLITLFVDGGTVAYDDPKCLPPKGSFTLPKAWSKLKKLTKLELRRRAIPSWRWNDFHLNKIAFDVGLPSEWSSLTNLQVLDVDLSGWARGFTSSPPSSYSTLKALTTLSVKGAYYNPYVGMALSDVDALAKQRAGWQLPGSWSTLTRLQTLSVYKYGMTHMQLPPSFSTMTNLTGLDLWGNCLQGTLPPSWGALKKLSQFSLPNNDRGVYKDGLCARTPVPTGPLPESWGALVKVAELHLSDFSLSGTIPSSWNRLTGLQSLKLSGNRLKGPLPSTWSTLTALTELDLHGNKLTGPLPGSWSKLKSVNQMDLSANRLTGQPPSSWSSLVSLGFLRLSNNRLSGSVPAAWYFILDSAQRYQSPDPYSGDCDYPSCTSFALDMSHNFLTGPMPAWGTHNLIPDVEVDLSHNKLSGALPAAPWKIGKLNVSHNGISGALPASWASVFSVNYWLDLGYNKLNGALPVSWATAAPTTRHSLVLSQNKLTGTIPKAYEKFSSLHLANNQLTGPVVLPGWTATPPNPEDQFWDALDWELSGNRLSGSLPPNALISSLSYSSLRYAHNELTGKIPASWFAGTITKDTSPFQAVIDLSSNGFTGPLPASWAAATYLNVSHNRLNGSLPSEWGKMWTLPSWKEMLQFADRTMPTLDLSDNQVGGALPKVMYGVRYLDVHKNKLSGSVPPVGSNWKASGFWDALTYLDISRNSFTGKKPTKPKNATYFNTSGNKFSG